jgi:acetyl esterase/lipase
MEKGVTWLLFAGAAVLLFLSAWIFLPGWTPSLLYLSVGAPEESAWLLLGSVAVCALMATVDRSSRLAQLTILLTAVAAALASTPIVRAPFAIRRFDAEMRRAFGEASARSGMRKRPIDLVDLFRGVDFGSASRTDGILFAAPDGQRLTLTIYHPPGSLSAGGPFPTVVQIYGGAWQRGAPNDNPEFARYLATRGYVVVGIDYRHAPQWTWPAQMADVRAALAWIREHAGEHGIDLTRLAVMGRSAGAQLAMLAAYQPDAPPIQAVVSYYGPVDLPDGYRDPPHPDPLDIRSIDEAFLGGTLDAVPDRYRDASPITYVTRPLPPTLLIIGTRDHIVEPRYGRMLHDRLIATGTKSALLEMPWADHAFDAVPSGVSAQVALYYTERFLAWALR